MAKRVEIVNLCPHGVTVPSLGLHLEAGETAKVTAAQAEQLAGSDCLARKEG